MMQNDAFSMGVAPGGLKDRSEIKLMVCYLLKTLNKSLTRTQINEILQHNEIANYFEINGAISDLIASGQVTSEIEDEEELITITAKTLLYVPVIERDLPRTLREKAVNAAINVLQRDRIKKESKVTSEPHGDGYHVTFCVTDMGAELLKVTIYVPDERQIEVVKRNFYDNAVEIYSNLISSFTVE